MFLAGYLLAGDNRSRIAIKILIHNDDAVLSQASLMRRGSRVFAPSDTWGGLGL